MATSPPRPIRFGGIAAGGGGSVRRPARAKALAFGNHKGGVGKTALTISIAAALGHLNKRVLLLDFDPQAHTTFVTRGRNDEEPSIVAAFERTPPVPVPTLHDPGVWIVPGSNDLTIAATDLVEQGVLMQRAAAAVDAYRDDYDYILVDCPPSRDLLTAAALAAVDAVVVPIGPNALEIDGLALVQDTIHHVGRNGDRTLIGVVMNRAMPGLRVCREITDAARGVMGDLLFSTEIPHSVTVYEATLSNRGVPNLRTRDRRMGTLFAGLAGEIVARLAAVPDAAAPEVVVSGVVAAS